jgi:hypothetical protein
MSDTYNYFKAGLTHQSDHFRCGLIWWGDQPAVSIQATHGCSGPGTDGLRLQPGAREISSIHIQVDGMSSSRIGWLHTGTRLVVLYSQSGLNPGLGLAGSPREALRVNIAAAAVYGLCLVGMGHC